MTHVMIRHRVSDYSAWKQTFDDFANVRKSSGEKSFQILQHDLDPLNLYLLFEWDNIENARKFLGSPELKEAMAKAGVLGMPEIQFLREVDRGALG